MKILSAIFSKRFIFSWFSERMDIKDKKLLNAKTIQAIPVNSSIKEVWLYFVIFKEVRTTRQNPNRFDDVFNMLCELFCFILFFFVLNHHVFRFRAHPIAWNFRRFEQWQLRDRLFSTKIEIFQRTRARSANRLSKIDSRFIDNLQLLWPEAASRTGGI